MLLASLIYMIVFLSYIVPILRSGCPNWFSVFYIGTVRSIIKKLHGVWSTISET